MPQPAGGATGGAGGGQGRDFEKILEGMAKEKKAIEDRIKILEIEIKTNKALGQSVDDLDKKLKTEKDDREKLTKAMRSLGDERVKELEHTQKLRTAYERLHGALSSSVKDYYSYNLALQEAIDRTGRFGGKSEQARRDFENLRKDLNLTTRAAQDFFQTWTEAMQLGGTNAQLKEMVRHLQSIRGQTAGLAAAKQILATPMTAELRGRVQGGDRAALIRATRTAERPEQTQAIIDMARKRPGTEVAERAVAFEMTGAKLDKIGDDIKMGMAAFVDKGFGPQVAAMMVPVISIEENVRKIAEGISAIKQFVAVGAGKAVLGGAGGAGLAGNIFGTGGGIGGTALTAGKLLKGGLFAAAGQAGGAGADWLASKAEEVDPTAAKWARVGGQTARGAGLGAAVGSIVPGVGTAIGAGVGAAGGGLLGIAQEFGTVILDKIKEWTPDWAGGAEKRSAKDDVLSEVMSTEAAAAERVAKNLVGLDKTIQTLPEAIESAMAERAVKIGKESIDRGAFAKGLDVIESKVGAALDTTIESGNNELNRLQAEKETSLKKLKAAGGTAPELKEMAQKFDQLMSGVVLKLQEKITEADTGRTPREAMERLEARRGQIGQERQAVTARFQLTGAVTGNRAEIERFQKETRELYQQDIKAIETETEDARIRLEKLKTNLEERLKAENLNEKTRQSLEEELRARETQLRLLGKTAEVMALTAAAEQRTANINAMLEKTTAYEKTAVYRRAQMTQALAKAQEEFARERGATPEEVGGFARQQAASSTAMLDKFMATFDENLAGWNQMMEDARAVGDEAGMLLAEKEIFALRQKQVELARTDYQNRLSAIKSEQQFRQEQIGVQKSTLETLRDYAAQTGQSWRVQMGYQSQIIQASRADLESSRKVFEEMKAAGIEGLPLMKQQLEVVQKEAALGQAILGKQRDFLDKAVAASFGMGGGTKALPNINPRIFGEVIKDVRGQLWQGAPKTMGETRGAMGGNLRGAIGVGGGGINAAPMRPGVNPAVGGAAAGAAGGGLAAVGGVSKGEGVDVSGNFAVAIKFDSEMFKSEVTAIAVRAFDNKNKNGAIG